MTECKICGDYFASSHKEELCVTCQRALDRLGDYVAPVRHGKWIPVCINEEWIPVCSNCKIEPCRKSDNFFDMPNYCSNCGAKMGLKD